MMKACIFNIQRYSLHDGGGIRSIVFFKGCPFHCPWCCNPESLSSSPQLFYKESLCIHCSKNADGICESSAAQCPTGAKEIIGTMESVDDVFDVAKRDAVFYETSQGGVTLSGGECLLQIDFAIALLKKCKEHNIHTAIESTLALPLKDINTLIAYTDVFLVDFKIMDPLLSKKTIGIDVQIMLNNVQSIIEKGGHVIARIPLIPTYTATHANINAIIAALQQLHIQEVHLLPFHQLGESKYTSLSLPYPLHSVTPLSKDELNELALSFQNEGFKTVIHGN